MYAHIRVGLDGSEVAEQILPHVEALAEKFHSRVTLLRAIVPLEQAVATELGVESLFVDPRRIVKDEQREAAEDLEHVASGRRRGGITVNCVTREGPPAQVILDYARHSLADLIALTTHGRGGLGRLVFGSVADEVLRSAHSPVLLVRAASESKSRGQAASVATPPHGTPSQSAATP